MLKRIILFLLILILNACQTNKKKPSTPVKPLSAIHSESVLFEKTKLNYITNCGTCHKYSQRYVGPPIVEIQALYQDNPNGIVTWAQNPGKKRGDYPRMPPQTLGEKELKAVAEYILNITE